MRVFPRRECLEEIVLAVNGIHECDHMALLFTDPIELSKFDELFTDNGDGEWAVYSSSIDPFIAGPFERIDCVSYDFDDEVPRGFFDLEVITSSEIIRTTYQFYLSTCPDLKLSLGEIE